ncbi:MAG: hypothetical protein ACREL5_01430 [Gemmatimonadales bacterium]
MSFPAGGSAQVPTWRVTLAPIATAGGPNGNSVDQDITGLLAAHRLPNGQMLVATDDPPELRLFDAHGRLARRVARKGEGPNEFRGRISLFSAAADSLLAFDDYLGRWTLYSPAAEPVRSWLTHEGERARFDPTDYRRTLIHPSGAPITACYQELIDRLPPPRDTAYREVFPDGADRAWVRDEGSGVWTVYALPNRAIARVRIPAQIELLQIGDGFVVGWQKDDDGVVRVDAFRVAMATHVAAPPCASRAITVPHDTSRVVHSLQIDLRNLETAGGAFHADYGHYAATLDTINKASNFTLSTGTEVTLDSHGGIGWDAVARNRTTKTFCRILIGGLAPIWLYRFAYCGV